MPFPRRVKRLSKKLLSMEYVHAANAKLYRHDFEDVDVEVWLMNDGSLTVSSARGRPLWGDFTVSDSE